MIQIHSPLWRSRRNLFVVLLLALLSGCGQTPNDGVIQKALNRELQGAHLAELLEVASVDNADRHRESDNRYAVDVQYTLRAKRDLSAYNHSVKNDAKRDTMDRFAMLMTLAAVRQQFGNFKKNDTFKQQRRITLERNQDGWHIPPPTPKAP